MTQLEFSTAHVEQEKLVRPSMIKESVMNIEYSLVDDVIPGSTRAGEREKESRVLRESTMRKSAKNNRVLGAGQKTDASRDWRKPQQSESEGQDHGMPSLKQVRGKEEQKLEDGEPHGNNLGYIKPDASDPSNSDTPVNHHHSVLESQTCVNLSNAHKSQHVHSDICSHRKPGSNNNSTPGNMDNRHLSTFSDFRAGNILDFSTAQNTSGNSYLHGGGSSAKTGQGKMRDQNRGVSGDDGVSNQDINDSSSVIAEGASYHFHNQQQQHDGMFLLPNESRFLKSKSNAHVTSDNSRGMGLNNSGGNGGNSLSPPGTGFGGGSHSSSHYELDSSSHNDEKRSRNAGNTSTYLVSVDAHHGADYGSASTSKIPSGGQTTDRRKVGRNRGNKY